MMSRVLLGVLDEAVAEHTHWDASKIGGKPDAYAALEFPVQLCALCKKQQSLIAQVYSPLNGSIYHRTLYIFSCTSRNCWNKNESWRVIRLQKAEEKTASQTQQPTQVADAGVDTWCTEEDDWGDGIKANEWCQDADDWGEENDSNSITESSPISEVCGVTNCSPCQETDKEMLQDDTDMGAVEAMKQMIIDDISDDDKNNELEGVQQSGSHCLPEEITLNPSDSILGNVLRIPQNGTEGQQDNPIETCLDINKEMTALGTVFKSYYISVIEEPKLEQELSKHERLLLAEYKTRDNVNLESFMSDDNTSKKKKGGTEGYEKSNLKHGDKIFHKFQKQLKCCPEQLLRYSWSGEPLHIRNTENLPRKCMHCQGPVVFEMQLMPALVNFLSTSDDQGGLIEFGTVLVFSCKESCWEDGDSFVCREEIVVVEPDPDQHLFKF